MNSPWLLIGIAVFWASICQPTAAADALASPTVPLASLSLVAEPNGTVDVPVQIAGHVVNLRLDTGDSSSELTETSANALKLPRDHVPYHERMLFVGADIQRVTEFAVADAIRFDHFDAPGAKFAIVTDNSLPFDMAGKLGSDILGKYDMEFDFARQKLNIYSPGQCAGIWPPGGATQLAMDVTGQGRITIDVQLDGQPAKALLNTGYPISALSLGAGKDMFGFTEKTPGLKALATRDGFAYRMSYPFKTLVLQGVTVVNPDIEVDTGLFGRQGLTIGVNVLRHLHFCIGYEAQKLYVALPAAH